MLTILFRMIVIGIFGLLGFMDLMVLKDSVIDLIHHRQLDELTGWCQLITREFVREYQDTHRTIFNDMMPLILSLILIIIFYLNNDLIITDILVAILIFSGAKLIRNRIEKIPPIPVRLILATQKSPGRKSKYSKLLLLDLIFQTIVSIGFTILPYIYVLIVL